MARSELLAGRGFTEVADRLWVARLEWMDVNVTVVEGDLGLLVVDTLGSEQEARALLEDIRGVSSSDVVAVVNTHAHFDHTFGNAVLRDAWPESLLVAQENTAEETVPSGERAKQEYAADARAGEIVESRILPADTTFASVRAIDLGDRYVELVHPGRGHTGGDLVVVVPDAEVVVAGDLVEESGPPAYGPDSFPLEWPGTVETLIGMLTPRTLVVPGHGTVVDESFVREQHHGLASVAETIAAAAGRSLGVEATLDGGDWPFPKESLGHAVERGLTQVPRTERRLPLV
jgi:glyoxylase-like metal-dependent hydrolase (beta-lactamase superfamily II)